MKNRLEGLNFLRIFSMIQILLFHAMGYIKFKTNNLIIDELISVGAISCTVFFVLSGFGLRSGYSELKIDNTKELKAYYKKRIIAIYPAYFSLLIVAY